jgi:hypothetical protein
MDLIRDFEARLIWLLGMFTNVRYKAASLAQLWMTFQCQVHGFSEFK